jgi:hypothetical protein
MSLALADVRGFLRQGQKKPSGSNVVGLLGVSASEALVAGCFPIEIQRNI